MNFQAKKGGVNQNLLAHYQLRRYDDMIKKMNKTIWLFLHQASMETMNTNMQQMC
jgi:hypothetical protein